MIGFPSVGKSTLLSTLTKTESCVASYEFTTLTCIPGVIDYKGANIQLLDLPGIIEGASQGKGRGRQVIAVARTADLVIMVLDACKKDIHKEILTKERKVTKPLEEIKDLFFHEKPVEIVELARPERTEKVAKKRIRQKAKSKRAFLSEANKAPQTTSSQRSSKTAAAAAGPETSALPFLVFQPFGSFLHDQGRSAEDRVEDD